MRRDEPTVSTGVSPSQSRRAPVRRRKGGRLASRTDNHALEATLRISSVLLWLFYSLAALYVAYCNSFFLEDANAFESPHNSNGGGSSGHTSNDGDARVGPATLLWERARLSHTYSKYYYYFFPEGFDIAAYAPLVTRVLLFSTVAIGSTYFLANRWVNGGEMLMVLAWVLGVFSERFWLTAAFGLGPSSASVSASTDGQFTPSTAIAATAATAGKESGAEVMMYGERVPTVPGWLWVVVSILTGFFSGIMCKVKDIADGKLDTGHNFLSIFEDEDASATAWVIPHADGRGEDGVTAEVLEMPAAHARAGPSTSIGGGGRRRHRHRSGGPSSHMIGLGERLYMVVPFCTGQWFAFILRNGWRGIIVENSILILTLGVIGYTMLSFKLLKEQVYRVSGRTTVVRYRRTVPVHLSESGSNPSSNSGGTSCVYDKRGGNGAEAGTVDGKGAASTTVVEEDVVDTSVDLIDLISKIFTTSFGAVAVGVVAVNVFITSLAIPFLKALFKLNALVSSVGILVELLVYEMA